MTETPTATRIGPPIEGLVGLRVRLVGLYAAFAVLWILGSDWLLAVLVRDRDALVQLGTYKGWMFVGVTSVLLYGVMRRLSTQTLKAATQQELRLLRSIADNSSDSIYAKDRDGRFLLFNRHASQVTGIDAAQALGRLDQEVFPAPSAGLMRKTDQSVIDSGLPCTFEHEFETIHGTVTYLTTKSPLRGPDGAVTGVFGISRDITELKLSAAELERLRDNLEHLVQERTRQLAATNRALAHSERFVRTMTDNMPAGLAYWGADMRCRFANRQYRRRFKLDAKSMMGRELKDVLGSGLYAELQPGIQAVFRGERYQYEPVVDHPGAGRKHYLVTLIPDMKDGKVEGVFVMAMEVTALKQAEQRLQQVNDELVIARDRAEAANRTKGTFLANMSHEIRTPINAIIGFTELLRHDIADPVHARRLDSVAEAADDLLQLINDILDLSKIESGKFELEHAAFSLDRLIAHATMLVSGPARTKGLRLAANAEGVPDALCGDPTRLSQALVNLLGNAVKFTEQGRIDLRVSTVRESVSDVMLRFEVRDTGIGIAADRLHMLFNAFEQADSSTTRRFGGTGLGLAVTRHLAELMGGEAGAQSQPDVGSTFWFTARLDRVAARPGPSLCEPDAGESLPLQPRAAGAVGAEEALRNSPSKAHVLVAEDNRFNQELAVAVLQRAGLSVDVVPDGRQALHMAQRQHYDLVLMDLHMPVMDGFDAARALRALPAYEKTPILALTANAFGETRAACIAAGMDDHIAKPVSPQCLYETLLRWLPQVGVAPPVEPDGAASGDADWLAGIDGIDAAAARATCGGSDEALIELLRRFVDHHEAGLPGLDDLLANGQRHEALLHVHSLKGAAAAVGATTLREAAASIEVALRADGETQPWRLPAFDLECDLLRLVACLRERLPPDEAVQAGGAGTSMSPAQLDKALGSLEQLLSRGEFAAQGFHRAIASQLRAAFGEVGDELARAVRNHDDRRGLVLIAAMRARARTKTEVQGGTT